MDAKHFLDVLKTEFYVGVPDSQLKGLCNYLISEYGVGNDKHIIAANEGNCVGIAAGYYLATGKVPLVYMQNSGEGNAVNPIVSLLNEKVYGIPVIFAIGWRGEPGVKDEPQHAFQGEITLSLLDNMNVSYFIVDENTSVEAISQAMESFEPLLKDGQQVAFVFKKNSLTTDRKVEYKNNNNLLREDAIREIVKSIGDDVIVCTTGKASRELFEIRDQLNQKHESDFLTVGSMGHASSIALGIAVTRKDKRVWCIDGDGAFLMHAGAMFTNAKIKPKNLVHVIINNEAHESVGGMPTAANVEEFSQIALSCGYEKVFQVSKIDDLREKLEIIKNTSGLCCLEIKCKIAARDDLGRPTISPEENMKQFMANLKGI
ncbi:phosphonopyruvate decarboxylase [Pseudobutyrivibrio sp. OR37]|uniref:phosphonopyruvate decarboxylase n=1 Tax=Pseudobutyrivibrio sp. OR37 TaxID=1798186 RepID=UPI0008F27A8E|nr:phosphonopyruvate decarboxylase [Pseudobutyrivibrio sp. OR37]SFI08487.1 phosphonopyruvate decarboxylase [Pseudobutyrivibrio sp. OR37]